MFDESPFTSEDIPEEVETKVEEVDLLEQARIYGILTDRKKMIESELDEVKSKMNEIQEAIAEKMLTENPRIRVKVGEKADGSPVFKTVHVKTELWAGHNGDEAALIAGMKEAGLSDLVKEKFNVQTLSGYVRGLDPDKKMTPEEIIEIIPLPMQKHIKVSKLLKLGCRS
jgi:hypothetical protein